MIHNFGPKPWCSDTDLLTRLKVHSIRLFAAISALAGLVSLGLPWWGIQVVPAGTKFNWGLYSGPSPPSIVYFNPDRITQILQLNHSFVVGLVVLSILLAGVAASWKRGAALLIALVLSFVTDLVFLADIGQAIDASCQQTVGNGASCISGLVGSSSGGVGSTVTWGFESGFYVFVGSGVLLLIALVLQRSQTVEAKQVGMRTSLPRTTLLSPNS
jgi:hypothetical protein